MYNASVSWKHLSHLHLHISRRDVRGHAATDKFGRRRKQGGYKEASDYCPQVDIHSFKQVEAIKMDFSINRLTIRSNWSESETNQTSVLLMQIVQTGADVQLASILFLGAKR